LNRIPTSNGHEDESKIERQDSELIGDEENGNCVISIPIAPAGLEKDPQMKPLKEDKHGFNGNSHCGSKRLHSQGLEEEKEDLLGLAELDPSKS